MTPRPDPLAVLRRGLSYASLPTWNDADQEAALAALAAVERLIEAARLPMFLECTTDPPCGDCPGCRLRDAIAPFDGGEA